MAETTNSEVTEPEKTIEQLWKEHNESLQKTGSDKSYSKNGTIGLYKTVSEFAREHVTETMDEKRNRVPAASGGEEEWPTKEMLEDGLNHFLVDADFKCVDEFPFTMVFNDSGYIDWGDGTTEEKSSTGYKTLTHTYTKPGLYTVTTDMGLEGDPGNQQGLKSDLPCVISSCANVKSYGLKAKSLFLRSVHFPKGTQSINYDAFRSSSVSELCIPDSVTSISSSAFTDCDMLTYINIPANVVSIDGYAFSGCSSVKVCIVNPVTPPTIEDSTFNAIKCNFYVPDESVDAYKAAANWSSLASKIKSLSECPEKYLNNEG